MRAKPPQCTVFIIKKPQLDEPEVDVVRGELGQCKLNLAGRYNGPFYALPTLLPLFKNRLEQAVKQRGLERSILGNTEESVVCGVECGVGTEVGDVPQQVGGCVRPAHPNPYQPLGRIYRIFDHASSGDRRSLAEVYPPEDAGANENPAGSRGGRRRDKFNGAAIRLHPTLGGRRGAVYRAASEPADCL